MDVVAPERPASSTESLSYLGQVLLVAIAYFAAAKLALSAGAFAANTVVVSPAPGLALAALLVLGYRVWPGVWLGAALACASAQVAPPEASLLGAGSTLEALVAALLVRRTIGVPRSFERGEDVVEFVAIAALSSAIAATVGTVVLGESQSAAQGLSWTWWMQWQADAMGIVVVAPLALNWSHRAPGNTDRKTLEVLCLA